MVTPKEHLLSGFICGGMQKKVSKLKMLIDGFKFTWHRIGPPAKPPLSCGQPPFKLTCHPPAGWQVFSLREPEGARS